MKVFLMSALLIVVAAAAAVPASRPSGTLLLLPAHQEYPPPAEYNPTTTNTSQPETNGPQANKSTENGRNIDSGEYYVLLPGGRLQMVKYSTAEIKDKQVDPAQPQVELVQFPLPGSSQYTQTQLQYTVPDEPKPKNEEEVSGFESKIQFRDVKPIVAPIYAYNPAPLVRILKK